MSNDMAAYAALVAAAAAVAGVLVHLGIAAVGWGRVSRQIAEHADLHVATRAELREHDKRIGMTEADVREIKAYNKGFEAGRAQHDRAGSGD